jgi:hypothetical protein
VAKQPEEDPFRRRKIPRPQRIPSPVWVPGDTGEGVEEEGLEGTPTPAPPALTSPRSSEVGEGVRNGLGHRSPHSGEAPNHRGRRRNRSDDAPMSGVRWRRLRLCSPSLT